MSRPLQCNVRDRLLYDICTQQQLWSRVQSSSKTENFRHPRSELELELLDFKLWRGFYHAQLQDWVKKIIWDAPISGHPSLFSTIIPGELFLYDSDCEDSDPDSLRATASAPAADELLRRGVRTLVHLCDAVHDDAALKRGGLCVVPMGCRFRPRLRRSQWRWLRRWRWCLPRCHHCDRRPCLCQRQRRRSQRPRRGGPRRCYGRRRPRCRPRRRRLAASVGVVACVAHVVSAAAGVPAAFPAVGALDIIC